MATIYEVSKLAGVSLATVSRVMNDSDKVRPKTREKVLMAMKELGYRPNTIARSLVSSRTDSVGVLVPELHGPFFSVVLSNIEEELRQAGKHVIITAGHSDEEKEIDGIDFLISRQCDALIVFVYAISDYYLGQLHEGPVPVVLIGHSVKELGDRCITVDNEQGSYLATRHLLDLGHDRIACIAGPSWKLDAQERMSGFHKAMAGAGKRADENLIVESDYEEGGGRKAMRSLLDLDVPFTGLVCANDEMAAGAIVVARENGISVPGDLSVIGFDNVFFTTYMNPELSTINYPIDMMGRMAARCVLRDVYGVEGLVVQNRFTPNLVIRGTSTVPNPQSDRSMA